MPRLQWQVISQHGLTQAVHLRLETWNFMRYQKLGPLLITERQRSPAFQKGK